MHDHNVGLRIKKTSYMKQKVENVYKKIFTYSAFKNEFGKQYAKKLKEVKKNRGAWLELCADILEKEYSYLLEDSYELDYENKENEDGIRDNNIWICWLQGEDDMPEIVQTCIQSVKKYASEDVKIHFITAENVGQFIHIPDYIIRKVNKGIISLTHLSDIIRNELLYRYGGLWLDATIFVSGKIPIYLFEKSFYSICIEGGGVYYGLFTSFLYGGQKHSPLFRKMLDFFYEYWKQHNRLIEGHWMNLWLAILYKHYQQVRKEIAQNSSDNNRIEELVKHINEPFDFKKWEELTDHQVFHKMNWRLKYNFRGNTICYYMKKIVTEEYN